MPAGVSGFISFHLMRKRQISQFAWRIILHLPQGKYFTIIKAFLMGSFSWCKPRKASDAMHRRFFN